MSGRLTAAAHHGGNRTRPQIAETAEFFEEFESILLQDTQGVRPVYSFLNVQKGDTKKENFPLRLSASPAPGPGAGDIEVGIKPPGATPSSPRSDR
jgi:hypothetical protein